MFATKLAEERAAFDLVKLYNITKLPVGTGPNGIILRADISKFI